MRDQAKRRRKRVKREDIPIVYHRRPRCELCDSWKLSTKRSEDNGDDTRTRDVKCRICKHRFLLVLE